MGYPVYDRKRNLSWSRIYQGSMKEILIPDTLYPDNLSLDDLDAIYGFSGLAKRVVKLFPNACWKSPVTVIENKSAEETPFEKAYREMSENLNLPYFYRKADILTGIGEYGCLYLGFDDGLSPDKPVTRAKSLVFIRGARQKNIAIDRWDENVSSPRYGMPEMYSIKWMNQSTQAQLDQKVHWTRIIHIAETEDESEVYGCARIQPIVYRILDVERTLGASAAGYFRHGLPGTLFTTDPEADVADEDIDAMKTSMEDFTTGVNRWLFSRGMNVQSMSTQMVSPESFITSQLQYIAMFLGVPMRMLMGTESGQYASSQDRNNALDAIMTRQANFCGPRIVEPLVDRCVEVGVLPMPAGARYLVNFEVESLASPQEKAAVGKYASETIKDFAVGGVAQVLPFDAFAQQVLGMSMSEEQITALVEANASYEPPDNLMINPKVAPRPDAKEVGTPGNGEVADVPADSSNFR